MFLCFPALNDCDITPPKRVDDVTASEPVSLLLGLFPLAKGFHVGVSEMSSNLLNRFRFQFSRGWKELFSQSWVQLKLVTMVSWKRGVFTQRAECRRCRRQANLIRLEAKRLRTFSGPLLPCSGSGGLSAALLPRLPERLPGHYANPFVGLNVSFHLIANYVLFC